MWKVGTFSGLNPFRKVVNGVMALGLCPPVNVEDNGGCKRLGQSDVPAWKAMHPCLEQINKWTERSPSLSDDSAGEVQAGEMLIFCVQVLCLWWPPGPLTFFLRMEWKEGPSDCRRSCGKTWISMWIFTLRAIQLIWACSHPCMRPVLNWSGCIMTSFNSFRNKVNLVKLN